MWRKLPSILLIALSLTACATASSNGVRYAGVPLQAYTEVDQLAVDKKITAACGYPPRCPAGALLEQWVLDYGKLRGLVRASNRKADKP